MGYVYNSRIERRTPLRAKRPLVPGTARLQKSTLNRSQKPIKTKRESPAMTRMKREVRERDNFTCQFPGCGEYDEHIDVHHKAKRSQRPDLKHDPENSICLCRRHHNWTDRNHDKAVEMGLLDLETYELAAKASRQ